jgi:hypothetical protein
VLLFLWCCSSMPPKSMSMREGCAMTCQRPLTTEEPEDAEVLDQLRKLIGTEALGRLLEARKVLGGELGVVAVMRRAADVYAGLLIHEQAGWAVQLARHAEVRPFSLG